MTTHYLRGVMPDGTWATIVRDIGADGKIVAERKWQAGLKPSKPQLPPDHGLFSDEASQLDLIEMFMEPTNEE